MRGNIPKFKTHNQSLATSSFALNPFYKIELLKNSIATINKTGSIDHFIKQKQDRELTFQQLYYLKVLSPNLFR
ncbi:conserved hypothetical protein [Leptospira interrogans serovar Manilae]|uniref:Uncharacterized protein n=1 Tax=Leptospira interrogans serovar Manilae TaxID=214675 RepID=A0AAQ1SPW8_LEPIR|nr:conserved hypothetical protein [Leptospira interrogans serovar Manilae]